MYALSMYLQKLEIQGFKSFASKTTLVFPQEKQHEKGITAVVGPNGSGKSNIADAIRWVMGEQSMKLLRSKHAEDVIFFGSDKKSQLGFCDVSLYFDNEDKTFPVDFPEVAIARRLYRTGESEYFINKNKVRLADVTLLLAQAQFGQRSYSVIGQGMVDHIVQMPPSERKEFFIEAAGVRQYQIKKENALNKIKTTKENFSHIQAMIHELEPKLRFLSRQMKRMEQREESEKKLSALLKHYFHVQWWNLSKQYTEQQKRLSASADEIARREKEQQELQAVFQQIEQEDASQQPGDFSYIHKRYEQLLEEKNRLITQQSVIEARMRVEYEQSGEAHIPWLMKRKQDIEHTLATQRAEYAALLSAQEQGEREEQDYLSRLTTLESSIQKCQKKRKEEQASSPLLTQEDIVQTLEALYAHKQSHDDSIVTRESLQQALHGLFDQIFSLIQTIKQSLSKTKEALRGHDAFKEFEELFFQKDALRSKLQKAQMSLGVHRERSEALQAAIEKHTAELAETEKELAYFSSKTGQKKESMLLDEKEQISKTLAKREKDLQEAQQVAQAQYMTEKESRTKLLSIQKEITALQRNNEQLHQAQNAIQLELARIETHQEELLKKIREELHLPDTDEVQSLGFSEFPEPLQGEEARAEIERLKRTLEQIGTIDQEIVAEHTATQERYDFLIKQMEDLTMTLKNLLQAIQELDTVIREKFDLSLEGISRKFQEYFQTLFGGGAARIIVQKREREDVSVQEDESAERKEDEIRQEDDVSGIDIQATPPGKKLKSMNVLSGGEKALTAIALLCAILSINLSPFIVLDEVDAALDESNATRLASILQELSRKTQFIVITHNRVTTHIARVLYGVTMGEDGTSHMISLDIGNIGGIVGAKGTT